jgi:hypothetical protein
LDSAITIIIIQTLAAVCSSDRGLLFIVFYGLCKYVYFSRFLLQAMSESHCFDWSLLLSLALRDAPLVNQVIGDILLLGMDELALENFIRLRDGIKTLENWAQHEW